MSSWFITSNTIFHKVTDALGNETWKNQEDIFREITNTTDNLKQIVIQQKAEEINKTVEETKNSENVDNTSSNIEVTGDITPTKPSELRSWDPRLWRLDGFLSTDKDTENPVTIIPFASNTAASAYYNMVFSLENAALKAIKNYATSGAETGDNTISGNNGLNYVSSDNIVTQHDADRVALGDKSNLEDLQKDGNMYGVASVINPYTLTKLCGSLVVGTNNSATEVKENRMYDIRDTRRFYDQSINTEQDFTSINNPTTTNIITWSNNDPWGRTPYSFLDFVFCKYWNIIPNNRLITLRKYHAPVYDNLQFPDMYNKDKHINNDVKFTPIATVLTYFGEQTGNTLSNLFLFTTGTNWKDIKTDIYEVGGDSGTDPRAVIDDMFTGSGGFVGAESSILKSVIGKTNWLTGKVFSFGKFMGLLDKDGYDIKQDLKAFDVVDLGNVDPYTQLYSNRILGPVNRIDSTKARDAGIVFDLKFTLTCEYISRPIGGINTKAVMLDILSNAMEIASADAAFWGGGYKWMLNPHMYPFKNNNFKNTLMDDLYKGKIFGKDGALAHSLQGIKNIGNEEGNVGENGSFDWSNTLKTIGNFIGEGIGAIGEMLSSIGSSIFGEGNMFSSLIDKGTETLTTELLREKGKEKLNNLLGNVNNMWRSLVIQKTVMPKLSNMRALLTGEPVGNWHLVVGNPLNPIMTIGNLICTQMQVTCSDELGPDDFPMEIKITYNLEHGMAREKGSIQSMFNRGNGKIYDLPDFIRASSDYETKVDKFTGNQDKDGWKSPGYMQSSTMGALNGGIGGYRTMKIEPGITHPINAHTDNTIITKFTPVDINMATSNIADNNAFLLANPGSRSVIRGTAITRKLMN